MAFLFRHTVVAVAIGLLLFCLSCEKHPLPEAEHVAPEKHSSESAEIEIEKPLSSPTPIEFAPSNSRP